MSSLRFVLENDSDNPSLACLPSLDFSKISHPNFESSSVTGAEPEILKRGGALCWPPLLADEENFRSLMD